MIFSWKNKYQTGIKKIDDQHKHFIEIINTLYTAINQNEPHHNLNEIVKQLIDYKNEHFNTEENLFEKYNYPLKEEHKKAHRQFSKKIKKITQKQGKEKIIISFDLIDFLEDWLLDHLKEQDQKYVKFFKDKGVT